MRECVTAIFITLLLMPNIGKTVEIAEANERSDNKIIVTSERQPKEIYELTSNLSAINKGEIEIQNHVHINELMSRTPSTWISRGNGQESLIAIRSPVLTGAGACGTFLIAEDGIPIRPAGFCNTNQLFEVNSEQAERIEIVRGPNSVLYGSNAVHGLINFITPNVFNQPELKLALETGSNQYRRGKFAIAHSSHSSEITQSGWMLYGNLSKDGGYQDDSGGEQQKVNFIHQYNGHDLEVKTLLAFSHLNQNSAGFIRGEDAYLNNELRRSNANPDGFRHANAVRGYSRWVWTFIDDTQFSITPYFRHSEMNFSQHWVPWDTEEKNSQSSVGSQAQYQFQWYETNLVFGLDTEWSNSQLLENQTSPFSATIPQGKHYDYKIKTTTLSPWISLDWQFNDFTKLTTGLRFDSNRYAYDNLLEPGNACADDVGNCRFYRTEDTRISYNNWSPKIGLVHQWRTGQYFYTQLSKGFRAPQSTELFRLQAGQQTADLNSEKLDSIEVGMRGLVNNLSYDLTLFDMHKNNFIFQDTERQNISNGKTRHQGMELALNYHFTQQFYSKIHTTIAKHEYANNIQISQQNINGNKIDTAPKTMGQLSLGWRSGIRHQVELQWQHLGRYYLNPENTASYPGHKLLHFNAKFEITELLHINLSIRNLNNKKYAERADFAFGGYRYFVGLPRSVYLSATINL